MFDKIRILRQNYILKQKSLLSREKELHNIDSAKSVAIVFSITDEKSWNYLNALVKRLTERKKKVFLFGRKTEKNINFVVTNPNVIICNTEDFDFWGIPKAQHIGDFFNRHYDVFIDATANPDFFNYYVTLNTIADFKIARDKDDNYKYFDFLIKLEDSKFSLERFFEETLRYLKMINLEK